MISADWFWVGVALMFLVALNAFLMWANHAQAHDIRRQRREIRSLRGEQQEESLLAGAFDADPVHDPETGALFLVPRQRDGRDS